MSRRGTRRFRLGTRGSRLALIQSRLVADRLGRLGHHVELVTVVTDGDVRPVDMAPGEGVFVAALEKALRDGEVDLAVHSAKDVPLVQRPDVHLGAYPERADPRDVLVGGVLAALPAGARIGTDSHRRAGFLLAARRDLRPVPLHGNVDTRLRRLDAGEADALALAAAGLDRLGMGDRIAERLDPRQVPPAPGQGALAVQCRSADAEARALLAVIDDPLVHLAVAVEREVLEGTGGVCRSPVGAVAEVSGREIRLVAGAALPDGSAHHIVEVSGEDGPALALAAVGELVRRVALPI